MPMVPVVSQDAGSTPEVGAPNVAPMRNFAPEEIQQTGATIERAGESQMRSSQEVATHIQGMMDDASVKAAETKFIQSAAGIYNDYSNKRGVDAVDGYDAAAQAVSKAKQDALEGLANPVQKFEFNRVAQQHLVTLGSQMSQHRAQQRIEYGYNEAMSRVDSARSMAQIAEPESDDQKQYLATALQESQKALSFKGIPADSDEAKKAQRAITSQFVADNVSRKMEDGDFEGASAILKAHVGDIEADTVDRLRRAVRGNQLRTENIKNADAIFAPYQNKQLRGTDLEEMLAKTSDIKNPEQQKTVQDMLRSKYNETRTNQEQQYRDNRDDVVNYKAGHGGSLKGVDPIKWGQLNDYDQKQLSKPPAVESDLSTILSFLSNPDSLTVDNVKHAAATGKLNKSDTRSLSERAVALANKDPYIQEASAVNDRIEYFANQAGIPVFKTSKNETEKASEVQLKMAVNNEIDRVKAQNKGKITSAEVDQIIKKELTQHTLSLDIRRSPWSPLNVLGNTYTEQKQKRTFEIPSGATHVAPGSDGKMHWTDGKTDLGVVE